MKLITFLALLIFSCTSLADSPARLNVWMNGEVIHSAEAEVELLEPEADPLQCSRAKMRREHFEKVNNEVEYILQKANYDTSKFSRSQLENLAALEKRRDVDFQFLSSPGPDVIVSWKLDRLPYEMWHRIVTERVKFDIRTFAYDWIGENSFSVPNDRIYILPVRSARRIDVIIHSQLMAFCFSKKDVNFDISLD